MHSFFLHVAYVRTSITSKVQVRETVCTSLDISFFFVREMLRRQDKIQYVIVIVQLLDGNISIGKDTDVGK